MLNKILIKNWLLKPTHIAPLAMFRILFGVLMLFSTVRFWLKGFIELQYIQPTFFFKFYGFHWVKAPPEWGIYALFTLMGICATLIALGLFYRIVAALFFLSFTYVELIDVSNYLNHYYFVSVVSLLLIFLPAHKNYSLDAHFRFLKPSVKTPRYTLLSLKILLAIVYIGAGIAKLNYDWLILAQPLSIWLPAQNHLPLIGEILSYSWVAYAFSWFGAFYDLCIVFFLWNKKTRPYAFMLVIIFHLLTWILFPIGVFPWVMIFSTLVFFSSAWHQKVFSFFRISFSGSQSPKPFTNFANSYRHKALLMYLSLFLVFQLIFPFRYLFYGGKLFWHEQGYRFSWRVMLMEKAGYATFFITNPKTGNVSEINPEKYLSINQVKQMSTQPDLILQFAHFLKIEFEQQDIKNPKITANVYVTLNGMPSKLLINPNTDLTKEIDSFAPKTWILPNA